MNNQIKLNHIELEISNPCNEKCVHCCRLPCRQTKKGFLSAKQAEDVLKQAKEMGAEFVTITGGEATLNPEWHEIVQIANNLGFEIDFFTNGTLFNDCDIEFFKNIKNLNLVQFSLYSLDEEIHDSITMLPGSCSKTKKVIDLFMQNKLPFFISSPVMKQNKTSIFDLLRWCKANNLFHWAYFYIQESCDYSGSNLVNRLSWQDMEELFEKSMEDNGKLAYIWGKRYEKETLDKIPFYSDASCAICVSGDGKIYPQIGWYDSIGDISKDKISDVFYNHPLEKKIRSYMVSDIPECKVCNYTDICRGACIPHITANHGKLGKVDKNWCKFIELKNTFINKRDELYLES